MKACSINQSVINKDDFEKLELTVSPQIFRFSPYGSILNINEMRFKEFSMYFLIQFDISEVGSKTAIYNDHIELLANESNQLELLYGDTNKISHILLTEIDFNKMYFVILSKKGICITHCM